MSEVLVKKKEIVKSNNLIESSYKLSASEQRLIYMASTKLKTIIVDNKLSLEKVKQLIEEAKFQKISIDITEYKREFNIKSNRIYEELEQTAKKLYNRNIVYIDGTKIVNKRWVITCEYDNQMGRINLQFHPDLIKDLLIFKSHFTILKYDFAKRIKNSYTYRIYELLKQYELYTFRQFELESFRFMLGIPDEEYPKYCNLKQKVINPSLLDINKNTDLYCELEEIKEKRKVIKLKFLIRPQKVIEDKKQIGFFDKTEFELSKNNDLVRKLQEIIGIQITAGQADTIINTALNVMSENDIIDIELLDFIKDKKNVADNYTRKNKVESYIGLLIKTIQNNWTISNKEIEKITNFNDYEQREYDYDKLEKKLLGFNEGEYELPR